MDYFSFISVEVANAQQQRLENGKIPSKLSIYIKYLSQRNRFNLLVLFPTSIFVAVLSYFGWKSSGMVSGFLVVALTAIVILYAALKCSSLWRLISFKKHLKHSDNFIEKGLDLVGFISHDQALVHNREGGFLLRTIKLWDKPEQALNAGVIYCERPGWWNRTDGRYFDGFSLRRTKDTSPSGALIELVIESDYRTNEIPIAGAARLIGTENNCILLLDGKVLIPRGKYLVGG